MPQNEEWEDGSEDRGKYEESQQHIILCDIIDTVNLKIAGPGKRKFILSLIFKIVQKHLQLVTAIDTRFENAVFEIIETIDSLQGKDKLLFKDVIDPVVRDWYNTTKSTENVINNTLITKITNRKRKIDGRKSNETRRVVYRRKPGGV